MIRRWLAVVVTSVIALQAVVESQRFGRGHMGARRHGILPHSARREFKSLMNFDFKAWWNEGHNGNRRKGVYNPYIRIMAGTDDITWSREFGWHSLSNEDEYHSAIGNEEVTTSSTGGVGTVGEGSGTTPIITAERPWKGVGSFTGDIKLHCIQNRAPDECRAGFVQVYHKELEQWGTICGERWHAGDADVVCRYLNFRKGKALRIGPAKTPDTIGHLPKFLKSIDCEGNEWALTDCVGDQLTTNYTCKSNKLAGVKCTGEIEEGDRRTCQKSETKCQDGDRCIDPEYICDGMADCPWGTDETGCTGDNCKQSEYWCGPRGGGCISNGYLCDGESDCIDESDERDCEHFLEFFEKTTGSKMKTKRYEVQWQPITAYLCAQKCKEESSFVCTSFDYFKKSRLCLLFSSSSSPVLRRSKKWDHYERQGVEDCTAMNKHACRNGSCILAEEVCDSKQDCANGEDEEECEPMIIRLRGGRASSEGRVEAAKGRKFGSICDTHWTLNEANVVCRQLNFARGAIQALKGGAFDRSRRKYVLDNIRCRGDETSLEECSHDGWNIADCKIDHEAGVVCMNDDVSSTATSTTTTTASCTTATTSAATTTTTPAVSTCGVKPSTPISISPMARIVGGDRVEPHEWPWQVGIWLPGKYWCGGSLIHPCWVLTAAHCFLLRYQLSDYTIRLGDHLTQHNDRTEQDMKIARIIKHDYNDTSKENDIALLQIVSDSGKCANLTDEVQTICLPKTRKQFSPPKNCTITGWGRLSGTEAFSFAYILQEATVPLIGNKRCVRDSEYGQLKDTMFCAGYMQGGIDSCQGDSGGPLSCLDEDDRYYVWGIVSWGHGCARPKAPGVYTKVSLYVDWIKENTGLDF